MRDKGYYKSIAGIVFLIFILSFLLFKFGPKIPLSVLTQTKGEPLIVSGTGKVSITPDIAVITVGIEENGTTLKDVQNSVNRKSKNLIETLKKLGINEKEIKTVSYNVYPDYNYDTRPSKITGYRVSTSYQVKVNDFEKINEVVVRTTEIGANEIGNISFDVNEDTKTEKLNEARKEAVRRAKEKAEGLAKAAGLSLGKIINVSEEEAPPFDRVYAPAAANSEKTIDQAAISPGETEITVTVSLAYEIR